jgi:restriction system protein
MIIWMVRAGRGGERADEFLQHGVVATSDSRIGAVPTGITEEQLLKLYAEKYPEEREQTRASWASQLLRFVTKIKVGDDMLTWDRERRRYVLGKVLAEYEWVPDTVDGMPHTLRVKWSSAVSRDLLATPTRNSLGAIQTLFEVPLDAAKDIQKNAVPLDAPAIAVVTPPPKDAPENDDTLTSLSEETFEADEFIEDAINTLDWKQMQDL